MTIFLKDSVDDGAISASPIAKLKWSDMKLYDLFEEEISHIDRDSVFVITNNVASFT